MFRSAAVGEMIADNWIGPKINKDNLVVALLLHDLGNIVKMDVENETGVSAKLIKEHKDKPLEFWREKKKEMIAKYGETDHEVTDKIVEELDASGEVKFIVTNGTFSNNEHVLESDNWELKIKAVSDQRIGPWGVLSLEERFEEVKKRYANRSGSSIHNSNAEKWMDCAFKIQDQVFANCKIKPEDINDETIKLYLEKY
ncbi:MAG: hypothetical protein HOC95_01820 [Candidatus Diapherotrites archaeon]|nr:hypothetical protein [Candidatus Diapherotrites archaeon]